MELEASSVIERLHALAQDAWRSIRTTPRHLMLVLLGTATSFAALLMFVGVVASIRGLPVSLFLSDPATIARMPFYTAAISSLGIVGWTVAATMCLFAAAVLKRADGASPQIRFLAASGCFSGVLLFDDLFLLHEIFFPYYVGVPQRVVLAAYVGLLVLYLIAFARIIVRTATLPMVAALACFGASALIDQVAITLPLQLLWEDGFKFLGIGCWLVYFFYAATAAVTGSRRSMPQNTSGGDVS